MKKILIILIACSACSGNLNPTQSQNPHAPQPTNSSSQCFLSAKDEQKLMGKFSFSQLMLKLQEVILASCPEKLSDETLENILDQNFKLSCDAEECHVLEK